MQIEKLLKDPQKLLETDWKEMDALKKKYPYSNLVSFLLARKHYLENQDIKNDDLNSAIFQNMNPGSTLSYVLNGSHHDIIQAKKAIKKEKSDVIKAVLKKEKETQPIEKKKDIKDKEKDIFKSDYTKWLMSLNASISKEKIKRAVKEKEVSKKKPPVESELKNEILSESLAQLYAMQGLKEEAINMYQKLSLKNPKKSTYFAEIIRKLKKD